jgi:NitT/TauT family transport system ATP-binding protein
MELVAEGIGHAFGALPVLDDVGLAVADGEIVALIGPSGCGRISRCCSGAPSQAM